MKNSIALGTILLFIICINLYAQDVINPPKFSFFTSSVGGYDTLMNRNTNPFYLAWNWGSPGRKLDNALQINGYHDFPFNSNDEKENMLIIKNTSIEEKFNDTLFKYFIVGVHNADVVLNAHCLQLEPTIIVDSTDNFTPRQGDTTGAVFGWLNKNIGTNGSLGNSEFDRFVLNRNSVTTPTIVLKNIWKDNILKWLDYDGTDHKYVHKIDTSKIWDEQLQDSINHYDTTWIWNENFGRTNNTNSNDSLDIATYHPFNGKQLYCSINLRALCQDSIEQHLDDTILVIRLPYKFTHYSNPFLSGIDSVSDKYVKFDWLPDTSRAENAEIRSTVNNNFRGVYRQSDSNIVNKPEYFAITGRMLKNTNTLTPNGSITLSALAKFTGDTLADGTFQNNPLLKNIWWENRYQFKDYITSLDVEVTYYGKLDVNLDWVRLESPRCQKVLRGFYDDTIRKCVDYIFRRVRAHPQNPKIYRFYADDEMLPSQWFANRYFNFLVDTLAALETFVHHNSPVHYLYATCFKEYWNGSTIAFNTNAFNPYIKKGHKSPTLPSYFKLRGGYAGNEVKGFTDINNSHYETHLENDNNYNKTMPITDNLIFTNISHKKE